MSGKSYFIIAVAVFLILVVGITLSCMDGEKMQGIETDCTEVVGGTCISCVYKRGSTRRNHRRGYYLVTASYEVNGVTYTTKGRSERPYEQRDPIGVHYDPSDPSKSYTGTGPESSNDALEIIVCLCMIPIVVFSVISKRAYKWRSG